MPKLAGFSGFPVIEVVGYTDLQVVKNDRCLHSDGVEVSIDAVAGQPVNTSGCSHLPDVGLIELMNGTVAAIRVRSNTELSLARAIFAAGPLKREVQLAYERIAGVKERDADQPRLFSSLAAVHPLGGSYLYRADGKLNTTPLSSTDPSNHKDESSRRVVFRVRKVTP